MLAYYRFTAIQQCVNIKQHVNIAIQQYVNIKHIYTIC